MNNVAKIRPSARILSTIGKNLIKDTASAVIELVKNSYDADSDTAVIKLPYSEAKNTTEQCKSNVRKFTFL